MQSDLNEEDQGFPIMRRSVPIKGSAVALRSLLVSLLLFTGATGYRKASCGTNCKGGNCRFDGCEYSSCDGGLCYFFDCRYPTCQGGACTFEECLQPTCSGGGCTTISTQVVARAPAASSLRGSSSGNSGGVGGGGGGGRYSPLSSPPRDEAKEKAQLLLMGALQARRDRLSEVEATQLQYLEAKVAADTRRQEIAARQKELEAADSMQKAAEHKMELIRQQEEEKKRELEEEMAEAARKKAEAAAEQARAEAAAEQARAEEVRAAAARMEAEAATEQARAEAVAEKRKAEAAIASARAEALAAVKQQATLLLQQPGAALLPLPDTSTSAYPASASTTAAVFAPAAVGVSSGVNPDTVTPVALVEGISGTVPSGRAEPFAVGRNSNPSDPNLPPPLSERINKDHVCKLPMVSFEVAVLALAVFLTPQGVNSADDFLSLTGKFFGIFCLLICAVSVLTPGGELVMLCCVDYGGSFISAAGRIVSESQSMQRSDLLPPNPNPSHVRHFLSSERYVFAFVVDDVSRGIELQGDF